MSQNFEYFGKYTLLEKLASGGMAEVFLARAPGAGGIAKFVAIKRILPQFSDNREFIDMFKDEAKIAVNLSHSNIVNIFEFGVENGQFFLVLDYVEGRNVRQILNKMKKNSQNFSIEQAVYIIKEVAAGLDNAHRCLDGATGKPLNITHRDMSPQNVMISFEGEVRIIDFGIAKAESQLENTRAGTLKGKFGYMSPEQAEGQIVDLRTDIFSLGIVLWELLAKDRLFLANNEINTLRKIRECHIPGLTKINPEIPAELERIVGKALTKDRNLRYQTAAAFHRDLNRFLNRQYPDFSPHDFSMFVKSIYADDILETRNRLIEYAKIPFRGDASQIPLSSEDERTLVINSDSDRTATDVSLGFLDLEADDGDESTNSMIDHDRIRESMSQTQSQIKNPGDIQQKKVQLAPSLRAGTSTSWQYPRGEQGYNPNTVATGTRSQIYLEKESSRSLFVLRIFFYFLCVIGSYLFLSTYFPQNMRPINLVLSKQLSNVGFYKTLDVVGINKTIQALGFKPIVPLKQPKEGSKSIASTTVDKDKSKKAVEQKPIRSMVTVSLTSFPSGAKIYYNDQPLGRTTPSRIQVRVGEPVEITLVKKNYVTKKFVLNTADLSEGQKFKYQLNRESFAYLNIDVRPPQFVQLTVNGKALNNVKLPLLRYKIPAGVDVDIKAVNPSNKASAQATVRVKEGQSQPVTLRLGRTPASR